MGHDLLVIIGAVVGTLAGVVFAAASFFWYVLPKREAALRDQMRQGVEVGTALATSKAERDAQTAQSVAAVTKDADAAKAEDTVAVANRLIGGK